MSEKKTFDQFIAESEVPVLVDVWMENCGPCVAMKPVLAELKDKMGEELKIIKINGPENRSFMDQFQIQAFPTLLLFHKGEVVWSKLGFTNAHMIQDAVKSHAAA